MNRYQPLLLGLGLLVLAGCDSAEQAAENFTKKVEEAAVETARESLGETLKEFDKQVEQLNDKVDQAQEDTRKWLNQAEPNSGDEPIQQDTENGEDPQALVET